MHAIPDHVTAQGVGSAALLQGVDLKSGFATYACTLWNAGTVLTATLTLSGAPTCYHLICHAAERHEAWTSVKPASPAP